LWQTTTKFVEQFSVAFKFFNPLIFILSSHKVKLFFSKVRTSPVQLFISWNAANWCVNSSCTTFTAVNDPLKNAHVLTETRPYEVAFSVTTEPVHVIDPRKFVASSFSFLSNLLAHF